MSDTFLETEAALQSLITELDKFRAASEQLTLAEEKVGDLLDACDDLVDVCRDLVQHNKEQFEATVKLAQETEQRITVFSDRHQTATASIEEKLGAMAAVFATHSSNLDSIGRVLQEDVKASLHRLQRIGSASRIVGLLLLVLGVANSAALAYIVLLLAGRI